MEHAVEAAPKTDRAPAGQRLNGAPASATTHPLLELQQEVGNQAVQSMLRNYGVQAKLAVSSPDDPDEREADAVAERVMRSPSPFVPGRCACEGSGEPCEECRAAAIQRKAVRPAPHGGPPEILHTVLRSPGRPLDTADRHFFEPRFHRDLSGVRIHTNPEAQESARAIQARAYTAGSDIVFDSGQYAPGTDEGRRLLAHELAHTVQQSRLQGVVHRQIFNFFEQQDSGEIPPDDELYDRSFAWAVSLGVDKCAELMARKLARYVASNANPYGYILEAFDHTPSRHEDNVASAFVALLQEEQLDQFAASEQGRAVLDMLYEAMMTGDVSGFERTQAARIDVYGLPGALKRQAPWMWFGQEDSSPEGLVGRLNELAPKRGVDLASEFLARKLRADIDQAAGRVCIPGERVPPDSG
jgi:hypothetical protein